VRTLKTPVAGLPAGTSYRIEDVEDLGRCVVWRGPGDRMDRIEKSDAVGTRAPLIYDAHVAALGCNPNDLVACGACGESIAACLTVCPECGADPGADIACGECDTDGEGKPTGYINYVSQGGRGREELCFACGGSKVVEAPFAGERETALAKARAWKVAQSDEANPVPAGTGGGR